MSLATHGISAEVEPGTASAATHATKATATHASEAATHTAEATAAHSLLHEHAEQHLLVDAAHATAKAAMAAAHLVQIHSRVVLTSLLIVGQHLVRLGDLLELVGRLLLLLLGLGRVPVWVVLQRRGFVRLPDLCISRVLGDAEDRVVVFSSSALERDLCLSNLRTRMRMSHVWLRW